LRQLINYAEAIADNDAPFLTQSDGTVYQFTNSTLAAIVSYLDHAYAHILDGIRIMREIVASVSENRLHPQIFDLIPVQKILRSLTSEKSGMKAEDLFNMLLSIPTTYYYESKKDEQPKLMFLSLVPIFTEKGRYRVHDVVTLPTHHQGILSNDWHRIKADDTLVLNNDYESLAIKKSSLACIKLPAHVPCDFCILPELEVSDFNPCLQKIMKGDSPEDSCEFEKLDMSFEESTRIGNNAWAYSDPTPGTVLETCGEKRTRKSLSTEGILNLDPGCSYSITNGPFVQAQMPPNVIVYPLAGSSETKEKEEDKSSDSILGEHFEDNDVYYVFGLSSALLLTIISFVTYCYRTGCCRRRNYSVRLPASRTSRRSRVPQAEIIEFDESRPPTGDLVPVLANLNNALAGYIQTV
jgi:hypothetical protein